jgi:hypothetical protein
MSSSRTSMTKRPTSTKRNRLSKAPVGHRRRERKRIRRASVLLLKSEGKAHPHSGSPFVVGWEPDERVEGIARERPGVHFESGPSSSLCRTELGASGPFGPAYQNGSPLHLPADPSNRKSRRCRARRQEATDVGWAKRHRLLATQLLPSLFEMRSCPAWQLSA